VHRTPPKTRVAQRCRPAVHPSQHSKARRTHKKKADTPPKRNENNNKKYLTFHTFSKKSFQSEPANLVERFSNHTYACEDRERSMMSSSRTLNLFSLVVWSSPWLASAPSATAASRGRCFCKRIHLGAPVAARACSIPTSACAFRRVEFVDVAGHFLGGEDCENEQSNDVDERQEEASDAPRLAVDYLSVVHVHFCFVFLSILDNRACCLCVFNKVQKL
jgi:hypothetical protein